MTHVLLPLSPDVLVLTSPFCFSTDVCLSVEWRPARFLLRRLELLLRTRAVRGLPSADIWRGLSGPESHMVIHVKVSEFV